MIPRLIKKADELIHQSKCILIFEKRCIPEFAVAFDQNNDPMYFEYCNIPGTTRKLIPCTKKTFSQIFKSYAVECEEASDFVISSLGEQLVKSKNVDNGAMVISFWKSLKQIENFKLTKFEKVWWVTDER